MPASVAAKELSHSPFIKETKFFPPAQKFPGSEYSLFSLTRVMNSLYKSAMGSEVQAVLLSILLYCIYLLLPLVPAILTYLIFPKQSVGAKGILAGLRINTTGAFAAYVITVILGYQPFAKTQALIDRMLVPAWTIKATVQLTNEKNEVIEDPELLETMVIKVDPKLSRITGNSLLMTIPGTEEQWAKTQIKLEVPNFGSAYIDLGEVSRIARIDKNEMMLIIQEPVKIPLTTNHNGITPSEEEVIGATLAPVEIDLPAPGDL